MRGVAAIEKEHEARYRKLLENVENGVSIQKMEALQFGNVETVDI